MKKFLLALVVVMTMGLVSCGGNAETTPEEGVENTDSLELVGTSVAEGDSLVVVEDTTVVVEEAPVVE